jgi:carboxypeptidase T
MTLYSVRIAAKTLEELHELDKFKLDLKHRAARQEEKNRYVVPGILHEDQIEKVKTAGYEVQIVSDLSVEAKMRAKGISPVNRFAATRAIDLEHKSISQGYLTVEEIESALSSLTKAHPDLVTLIELPNHTWEDRISHAVRVGAGAKPNKPGILFTGSMHAREWGGSDVCINFLYALISSYINNSALSYGGKTFTSEQIKSILENLEVFVFPDVNPDGKHFSQTGHNAEEVYWRKNRNPNKIVNAEDVGVDINRNFDFLWSSGIGTSADTSDEIYKGTGPFSEPENKNVQYILDAYSNIGYYLDVHSYSGLIMYSWGDSKNQSIDPNQNFHNPAYDGVRGGQGSDYEEYIPAEDESKMKELANRMNDALAAVRGRPYEVEQSVGLYPTSSTSDDYAFSRYFVDGSKNKVLGFTIEFGEEFIPEYSEMKKIIDDVCSAMTELCLTVSSE